MTEKKEGSTKVQVGDQIKIQGTKQGIIHFIGKTGISEQIYIGCKLNKPNGNCDGTKDGIQYFECKTNYGLFVPLHSNSNNATTRQLEYEIIQQSLLEKVKQRTLIYEKNVNLKKKIQERFDLLCKTIKEKGLNPEKLIANEEKIQKIKNLKKKLQRLKNEEKETQLKTKISKDLINNLMEQKEINPENIDEKLNEIENQKKDVQQEFEKEKEKIKELDRNLEKEKLKFQDLTQAKEQENLEIAKIMKIRKEEMKTIEKENQQLSKTFSSVETKFGLDIVQIGNRMIRINKQISNNLKKIDKLEKTQKMQNNKKAQIPQELKNKKSVWVTKLMNNHPDLLVLREKMRPILKTQTYGKLRTAKKVLKRNAFNSEEILQLIMQHFSIEEKNEIKEFIEEETGIIYEYQKQPESILVTLLRLAIKKDYTISFLTMQPEEHEQEEENEEDEEKEKEEEEMEVNRNIVLSLDDDDVNVWDEPENNPKNFIYDKDKINEYKNGKFLESIHLSNINKFITHLIHPRFNDEDFIRVFLMTYHDFLKPEHLFLKLVQRYHLPPYKKKEDNKENEKGNGNENENENENENGKGIEIEFEMGEDKDKKETGEKDIKKMKKKKENEIDSMNEKQYKSYKIGIQRNVINFLDIWITNQITDFSPVLLSALRSFIENDIKKDWSKDPKLLLQAILQAKSSKKRRHRDLFLSQNVMPSDPVIPKALFSNNFKLEDLKPIEFARQITLFFHKIYKKIQPSELINQAWSKKHLKHKAQNVISMINKFNDCSVYIAEQIVSRETLKERAKQFDRWIKVAKNVHEINNFDGLLIVISGVNNSSCKRLKHSHEEVSKTNWKTFAQLREHVNSDQGYKVYRENLENCELPAIPYLGVYLTDLTFISDGSPSVVDGLINFSKRKLLNGVISKIKKYQSVNYNFSSIYQVQELLKKKLSTHNEKTLYELSLKNEPRGVSRNELN
ncbi:guanine nucleotide exchange factor [Anaeramoeba flamelloides]|uniref:Guanine nucleotide exchange factor n=1 Tax=Anaeramoeba flamelloides TaxID=1746091 RepID=A0ABQ8Z444_9EUKA|nr:guanine nucleotide exchange factor [Anaeramoeba flamelloides]